MKYGLFFLLLFLGIIQNNLAAPRQKIRSQSEQVVYVPVPTPPSNTSVPINPLERDKLMDQALFAHFVSILGNFGKVLLDPHNKENVTTHVANMIDGIVSVAQTVTRSRMQAETPLVLKRIALALMISLARQRHTKKHALRARSCRHC
ncbi:MAG: hypothetical protein WDZ41_00880 [Candidatus Babeliales bacterium]